MTMPMLEEKRAGLICYVHDCLVPDPRQAVVWVCGRRHHETLWYCDTHGPEMMAVALRSAAHPLCLHQGCGLVSYPLTEGTGVNYMDRFLDYLESTTPEQRLARPGPIAGE